MAVEYKLQDRSVVNFRILDKEKEELKEEENEKDNEEIDPFFKVTRNLKLSNHNNSHHFFPRSTIYWCVM